MQIADLTPIELEFLEGGTQEPVLSPHGILRHPKVGELMKNLVTLGNCTPGQTRGQ